MKNNAENGFAVYDRNSSLFTFHYSLKAAVSNRDSRFYLLFDFFQRVAVRTAEGANGGFAFGNFKSFPTDLANVFFHNFSPWGFTPHIF